MTVTGLTLCGGRLITHRSGDADDLTEVGIELATLLHRQRARQRLIDRRFASADSQLLSIVKLLGDHMLTDLKASGHILDETRLAIFENLEKGKVTLELISERLGLSPRGLQSRLKEAGKPFYVLLSETRATAATRYLRDTDLPLVEIAYLLGFSEQSAFTRAAQRWYDESPSVMRQK